MDNIYIYTQVGGDWNMTGLFFHSVGKFIIPIDELIFFGGLETTNQTNVGIAMSKTIPQSSP